MKVGWENKKGRWFGDQVMVCTSTTSVGSMEGRCCVVVPFFGKNECHRVAGCMHDTDKVSIIVRSCFDRGYGVAPVLARHDNISPPAVVRRGCDFDWAVIV